MTSKTLNQPGAEQRYGGVPQRLGLRNQVITISVIQRDLKGFHEPALAQLLGEQERIAERDTLPAQRVLDSQNGGIEHEAALVLDVVYVVLPEELRPQVMTRQIGDPHVHNFIRVNERREVLARIPGRDVGMTQQCRPGRPQQVGYQVCYGWL